MTGRWKTEPIQQRFRPTKAEVEKALHELQKTMGEKVIEGEVIESGSEVVEGVSHGFEGDPEGDPTDSD